VVWKAWSRRRRIVLGGSAGWLALCLVGELIAREPALPEGTRPAVALLSAPIPVLGPIARHSWLLVRAPGEPGWERWDLFENGSGPLGLVSRRPVGPSEAVADMGNGGSTVEWVMVGEAAADFAVCLRREGPRYAARDHYRAWPGPNSNSFVDAMLRACDLARPMSATAIGKDYRGLVGVSIARERTGVQLETPLVGASLGLREGVEVHAFALTVGIDLWPPAIVLPFGEGRFGFSP
jgi:hypothetical protein